jgi:uncharacterized membrane protein
MLLVASTRIMDTSETLVMFAVIAAFGLVTATVVVLPIIQQAHAAPPLQACKPLFPGKSPCARGPP